MPPSFFTSAARYFGEMTPLLLTGDPISFAEMMRLARAGQEMPLTQRARYRWDTAKATDWCVKAVDILFEASGGGGIYLKSPIQRAWRDVHAIRAHAGNNPERAAAIFGRSEFDLPPTDIRF